MPLKKFKPLHLTITWGLLLIDNILLPQLTQIHTNKLSTLNDFQEHLGDISWLRPSSGIANYQLNNVFNTLKGDPDLNSPCSLSQEAQEELYFVKINYKNKFLLASN